MLLYSDPVICGGGDDFDQCDRMMMMMMLMDDRSAFLHPLLHLLAVLPSHLSYNTISSLNLYRNLKILESIDHIKCPAYFPQDRVDMIIILSEIEVSRCHQRRHLSLPAFRGSFV